MHATFTSLHELMVHAKGVTYVLMGLVLLGMVGFWLFLSGREPDESPDDQGHGH